VENRRENLIKVNEPKKDPGCARCKFGYVKIGEPDIYDYCVCHPLHKAAA
jgi:hypothetical protein